MRWILLSTALMLASPAAAEVLKATDHGFVSEHRVDVTASPSEVYRALVLIGRWWSDAHTYFGSAANMSMDAAAGGCFCERLPADGGSVEHMRVAQALPGKMLRLRGGLGPLQGEGVDGALTWTLTPKEGGTEILQTYVVGGYIRGDVPGWAAAVDGVLGEQLRRLAALFAKGEPNADR